MVDAYATQGHGGWVGAGGHVMRLEVKITDPVWSSTPCHCRTASHVHSEVSGMAKRHGPAIAPSDWRSISTGWTAVRIGPV